jgi:hypothetical protein
MRVSKRASIVAALVCIAMLLFTGCDKVGDVKSVLKSDADILESAYFYDEDTGAYRSVVIVQNNTANPIEYGYFFARAFDENGERINSVKTAEGDSALLGTCYWLSKGEKNAVIFTNDGIVDDDNFDGMNSILDHYTAVPATLEWEMDSGSRKDPNLPPHGLSLTGIEPYVSDLGFEGDYMEYMATIHNDSDIDYTFDDDNFEYAGGGKRIGFDIVAVYRDADGNIRDMQKISYTGLGGMPDIAAGSDTEIYVMANHTVKDESLTPEYYISITDLTDEEG